MFINTIQAKIFKLSLQVEKRIRFVVSSAIIASLMLFSTLFFFDKAVFFIPLFLVASYSLTYFSILQGIEGIEWYMLFIMPVFFTISFYLFFLLFPIRWLTRVPFILIYGFSSYAILLSSNIFNVGVEKSLQLYRAAFSINYFYHSLVVFLISNVIFSFHLSPLLNGMLLFAVGFMLSLQLLWSAKPSIYVERVLVNYAILIGLVTGETAVLMSFLPLRLSLFSLFTTALYYSMSGILYHYVERKLFAQTIREYLIVLIFVLIIILLAF